MAITFPFFALPFCYYFVIMRSSLVSAYSFCIRYADLCLLYHVIFLTFVHNTSAIRLVRITTFVMICPSITFSFVCTYSILNKYFLYSFSLKRFRPNSSHKSKHPPTPHYSPICPLPAHGPEPEIRADPIFCWMPDCWRIRG